MIRGVKILKDHIVTTHTFVITGDPKENPQIQLFLRLLQERHKLIVPDEYKVFVYQASDIEAMSGPDNKFYLDRILGQIKNGRDLKAFVIISADSIEQINRFPSDLLIQAIWNHCSFVM